MINLAPWYYRKLLIENELIKEIKYFEINLLTQVHQFEAAVYLKENLVPSWVSTSEIYRNCEGSGTSTYKNISVYKAISEALERLAFFESVDSNFNKYRFDLNPSTTGMAAYPYFTNKYVRKFARAEAIERWALIQLNYGKLPLKLLPTNVPNLWHYEIITPFKDVKVSLLSYQNDKYYTYGFAGGKNLNHSFERALVELDRNIRVLNKMYKNPKQYHVFTASVDRTLSYFSTEEGHDNFKEIINKAPKKIECTNPKVVLDVELKGRWSQYTTVWRYLLEDSHYDCHEDHTFFMF